MEIPVKIKESLSGKNRVKENIDVKEGNKFLVA